MIGNLQTGLHPRANLASFFCFLVFSTSSPTSICSILPLLTVQVAQEERPAYLGQQPQRQPEPSYPK
jgi:hypothetical protein